MPSPRNGTVSNDIPKAIKDALRGVTEIKPDRSASIRTGIGKLSFTDEQLFDNLKEFIVSNSSSLTVIRYMTFQITLSSIKPPTVKNFVNSVCVKSSQGPSFFLDMRFITPGRYFFNEELADTKVIIPEKVKKPSTRKRHMMKESQEANQSTVDEKVSTN